jgi:hypothetical protein
VNPQALGAVSKRKSYDGDPRLGQAVDGDTWLTPRWILSQLGSFDLDPCAAAAAPDWVARHSYVLPLDGLEMTWFGRVFMNPPFSNTVPWLERHAEHGRGISLVSASTESTVWRELVWKKAQGILLLAGRTRFSNPDGSITTGRPLRPVCLIAWSPADREILEASTLAGVFLTSWSQR